ncbi:MAG: hypothetical protein FWG02_04925 [Holophagaceae bacterium]|nr:hypothetical protein [Holophagaceae bacterium]
MFIHFIQCLALAVAFTAPQEKQTPAPSAPQDAKPITAKFRVDPTGFPNNYAFRLELKAKIVASDSIVSDKHHSWDISYKDGKPIANTPLLVEYVFSHPRTPSGSPQRIEFEGELVLLIDGEIDSKVPIQNTQSFSTNTLYTFQIKNNGEEDGKPAIGINFLTDSQNAPVLRGIPQSAPQGMSQNVGIRQNADGTFTAVDGTGTPIPGAVVRLTGLATFPSKVDIEIHAVGFPANYSFQLDLKLKCRDINTQNMMAEGRRTPSEADILAELVSKEKHKWDIAFDENGKAKIEGSPQRKTFNFPNTNAKPSLTPFLSFDGSWTVLIDGKAVAEDSISTRPLPFIEQSDSYVLLLQNQSTDSAHVSPVAIFLRKESLKDALEGRMSSSASPFRGTIPQTGDK